MDRLATSRRLVFTTPSAAEKSTRWESRLVFTTPSESEKSKRWEIRKRELFPTPNEIRTPTDQKLSTDPPTRPKKRKYTHSRSPQQKNIYKTPKKRISNRYYNALNDIIQLPTPPSPSVEKSASSNLSSRVNALCTQFLTSPSVEKSASSNFSPLYLHRDQTHFLDDDVQNMRTKTMSESKLDRLNALYHRSVAVDGNILTTERSNHILPR